MIASCDITPEEGLGEECVWGSVLWSRDTEAELRRCECSGLMSNIICHDGSQLFSASGFSYRWVEIINVSKFEIFKCTTAVELDLYSDVEVDQLLCERYYSQTNTHWNTFYPQVVILQMILNQLNQKRRHWKEKMWCCRVTTPFQHLLYCGIASIPDQLQSFWCSLPTLQEMIWDQM